MAEKRTEYRALRAVSALVAVLCLVQLGLGEYGDHAGTIRILGFAVAALAVVLLFLLTRRAGHAATRSVEAEKSRTDQERKQLEATPGARTAELSELVSYLHAVREEERRVLARELHDELGSLLTAAKFDVGYIQAKTAQSNPEVTAKCTRVAAMIDQSMALKRRVIDQLRPSTLDMLGLAPAIRELVDTFAATARLSVNSEVDSAIDMRNDGALAIYRTVQEALSNVRHHAGASAVEVQLERTAGLVHARIHDNGQGFEASSVNGHGLAGMRERVRALGGKMAVVSAPGSGTTVEVWMPLQAG